MVAAASPTVVMNFEKTKYVDSSILQCIVALREVLLEREAQLVVVGLHDGVSRLFDICQFEQIFDIRQSVDDQSLRTLARSTCANLRSAAATEANAQNKKL